MIRIDGNAHTRTITDDLNPRIHIVEHRCARCGEWMPEDDAVWIPNWSEGQPYHADCAPEEDDGDPIRRRAVAVATAHFRCDDGAPWEPYEHRDDAWIEDQIEALADAVEAAIRASIEEQSK